MSFTIATWNVNSLKVRFSHILEWLKNNKIDVLALQEIKTLDGDSFVKAFQEAGYQAVMSGQKTYNGVAILSRQPLIEMATDMEDFVDPQRRILAATINDIRIVNLYIPNGERLTSEKYQYKLQWLKGMRLFLEKELKKYPKMIVLGDFNIAPEDQDVHDPKAWEGNVLVSHEERLAFQQMLQLGLQDCFRLHAQPEKSFSWWDYRMNAFKRNMGLRIDHILASQPFLTQCVRCFIDKTPRAWDRPSDHTPVVAEFLT